MKDFVSRITFGFFMAQFFPGAVTVFAISFCYLAFFGELPNTIVGATDVVLTKWGEARSAHLLFLTGLCIAFGMLIHGVHWTILGAIEQRYAELKKAYDPPPESMFDLPWDRTSIVVQILVAPVRMLRELLLALRRIGVIRVAVLENVARIKKDWMEQHEFAQDFYLYTAQFFAHTAYALIACEAALIAFCGKYGFTPTRVVLLFLLCVTSSTFFVLARVQLATLFRAEQDLIAKSSRLRLRRYPPRLTGTR